MLASNAAERDNARPTFFKEAVKNNALSEQEGRPIFDEKEMVKIEIPGDRNLTWIGVVDEKITNRFPAQYASFKRGDQRAASGTPLEQWPSPDMTTGQIASLKALNILSVEELANVTDAVLPKIGMKGRELREQARAYIQSAKDSAATNRLAQENAELRKRLEMLEQRITGVAPVPVEAPADKSIDDCTDDELKEFIKRETGQGMRGQPSRETLLARVREIADKKANPE